MATIDDTNLMRWDEVKLRYHIELKPCPFCRCTSPGIYLSHNPHGHCWSCEADGPVVKERGITDEKIYRAALRWNTRP